MTLTDYAPILLTLLIILIEAYRRQVSLSEFRRFERQIEQLQLDARETRHDVKSLPLPVPQVWAEQLGQQVNSLDFTLMRQREAVFDLADEVRMLRREVHFSTSYRQADLDVETLREELLALVRQRTQNPIVVIRSQNSVVQPVDFLVQLETLCHLVAAREGTIIKVELITMASGPEIGIGYQLDSTKDPLPRALLIVFLAFLTAGQAKSLFTSQESDAVELSRLALERQLAENAYKSLELAEEMLRYRERSAPPEKLEEDGLGKRDFDHYMEDLWYTFDRLRGAMGTRDRILLVKPPDSNESIRIRI